MVAAPAEQIQDGPRLPAYWCDDSGFQRGSEPMRKSKPTKRRPKPKPNHKDS